MPQMAPIGWLNLFIIFSITFMLFCMINYFSVLKKSTPSSNQYHLKPNSMNWKW